MLRARSPFADDRQKVIGADETVVIDVRGAFTSAIRVYAEYAETDKLDSAVMGQGRAAPCIVEVSVATVDQDVSTVQQR